MSRWYGPAPRCRECGEIINSYNGRRYCSNACRQRAYRARARRVTAIAVTREAVTAHQVRRNEDQA